MNLGIGVFEFVLLLVLITSLFKAGTALLLPISRRLAELIGEMAADKRHVREGGAPPEALPAEGLGQLEERIDRLEERLDFVEQLRAPDSRPAIPAGAEVLDGVRGDHG